MEIPEESTGHLLDPDQIKMLIEAGASDSLDLFREILTLFEEESRNKFSELRAARDTGDYVSLGRASHAIAGSSANIGGRVVFLKAKEIENLCKGGSGEQAAELLPDLEETFQETLVQLRHLLHQLQAQAG